MKEEVIFNTQAYKHIQHSGLVQATCMFAGGPQHITGTLGLDCTHSLLCLLCLGYDNDGVLQLCGDDRVSVPQGEYRGAVLERSTAGEEACTDILSRSTTTPAELHTNKVNATVVINGYM